MFNLFNKSKVFSGKQNNKDEKKPVAAAQGNQAKKPAPFAALGKTWAKLNKMDQKQAYTFGAIAVVVLVALVMFGTALSSGADDSFEDFQTRGYDLANMPFSTDEAEQYLLASKYPDMQNTNASGLYSKEEKEKRQAEDAAEAQEAVLDTSSSSQASEYVPGRYYGGGSRGPVTPTQVGTLNSASLKSASGSGISGTFGPSGDFSNFKSQEKGSDKFTPQGPGSGNARTALFQTAKGSRAAAGLRDNKLLNAKKAMMGGNVKGSDAFLSDSGAVDLSKAAGLNLDTNAPVSSPDIGKLDNALQDAKDAGEDAAQDDDEQKLWEEMLVQFVSKVADMGVGLFQQWAGNQINIMTQTNARANAMWSEQIMNDYQNRTIAMTDGGGLSSSALNNMSEMQLKEAGVTRTELGDGRFQYSYGDQVINSTDTGAMLTLGAADQTKVNTYNAERKDMSYREFHKESKKLDPAGWNYTQAQARAFSVVGNAPMGGMGGNYGNSYGNYGGFNSPGAYISVNGVNISGRVSRDGNTFMSQDGRVYTSTKNEDGSVVWKVGN